MSDAPRSDERCAQQGPWLIAGCRREPVQLGLMLFFALAVHLPKLEVSIGSPDEEGSPDNPGAVQICRESLGDITTRFYKARNHPLFSILAHFSVQHVPAQALVAARLPALAAGLAVPFVFYFTQRRWVGREAALLVSFLLVVVDPLHHYVTSARGYAMLVLGALVMNELLVASMQRPRIALLAAYCLAAAATAYTHLWAVLLFGAHAVYFATCGVGAIVSRSGGKASAVPARVWLARLAAIVLAAALVLVLYKPMLADILAMAGARRASRLEGLLVLGDALLQLARFRDATLAAYVLLVPIVLEGAARKLRGGRPGRVFWFHVTVLVAAPALTLLAPPQNFDSRFLMGIIPSGAALVAWGFSGYWEGSEQRGGLVLPRTATWLAGFALGVLVSNANMTVDIPRPAITSHTDASGADHGYFYRNLPKAVGSRAAVGLLGLAVAWACLRRRRASLTPPRHRRPEVLRIGLCSALLMVSLAPLALGPSYFPQFWGLPRWVFEVHLPVTAAIWLLAWEHRFDPWALRGLRYGLLMTVFVVAVWQLGGDRLEWDAWASVRLLAIAPPALVGVAVARESE